MGGGGVGRWPLHLLAKRCALFGQGKEEANLSIEEIRVQRIGPITQNGIPSLPIEEGEVLNGNQEERRRRRGGRSSLSFARSSAIFFS